MTFGIIARPLTVWAGILVLAIGNGAGINKGDGRTDPISEREGVIDNVKE